MSDYNLIKYDRVHYYENILKYPSMLVDLIEDTDLILNENSSITKWSRWEASDASYEFGYQKFINQTIIDETNPLLISINKQIRDAIVTASKDYADIYKIDLGYLTPISIAKYSTGKQMGPHVDSYGDERSPVLSVVLYLNDDYDGGDLYFPNQNISIKPSAGSLVAFPSIEPYYHQSNIVTRGIKYMSPGFWYKNWHHLLKGVQ